MEAHETTTNALRLSIQDLLDALCDLLTSQPSLLHAVSGSGTVRDLHAHIVSRCRQRLPGLFGGVGTVLGRGSWQQLAVF